MTNAYRAVQWNAHKRTYDLVLAGCVIGFIVLFVLFGRLFFPPPEDISIPVLIIRALGVCAILMLHLILIIGPLARITPLAAPLLYNRRHLGVSFFIVALLHGLLVIGFYGGFGIENPVLAVLDAPPNTIPFEFLGFLALIIFALMATTSHDYWLANLGDAWWKALHMLVYLAYVLVIAHVLFGVLQSEKNVIPLIMLALGVLLVISLHLYTGVREVMHDFKPNHHITDEVSSSEWVDVCSVDEINHNRARVVQIDGQERIAIFRHNNTLSAVTNVCAHQGGPLGEGKVVDGCITCPWHGYQYKPECGSSPPPYTEKIATYELRVQGRRVLLNPKPNEPGTHVEPAKFDPWPADSHPDRGAQR
jgi:sulfoxide reductase heme-binding subunit YedZ